MDILKARKNLFYVFTAIYVIVCPVLILYARGFWYKPDTDNIVETGVISINTRPSGADIFLNNKKVNSKTPTVIRSLPPGEYFLLMRLKEYEDYKTRVRVDKGKAVVLEEIKLIQEDKRAMSKHDI